MFVQERLQTITVFHQHRRHRSSQAFGARALPSETILRCLDMKSRAGPSMQVEVQASSPSAYVRVMKSSRLPAVVRCSNDLPSLQALSVCEPRKWSLEEGRRTKITIRIALVVLHVNGTRDRDYQAVRGIRLEREKLSNPRRDS